VECHDYNLSEVPHTSINSHEEYLIQKHLEKIPDINQHYNEFYTKKLGFDIKHDYNFISSVDNYYNYYNIASLYNLGLMTKNRSKTVNIPYGVFFSEIVG
jgi:hypothetical protein